MRPSARAARRLSLLGEKMRNRVLLKSVLVLACLSPHFAHANTIASTQAAPPSQDGQHDFDFEIGTWKIHLKRLVHPLTGSTTWTEFDGTTFTQKVWNGRANLEQFETNGSAGQIEGMTLRLYNPDSHQWSIYWATSKTGIARHSHCRRVQERSR